MAWALDQANVFEGNDGGVGDNPANFTTIAAVAANGHLFVLVHSDILPTGVTAGGTAMTKDEDDVLGDYASLWSVRLPSGLASSSTIAVSFGAAPNFCAVVASSFTGGATSNAKDQGLSGTGTSAFTTWNGADVTPSVANTLVIGIMVSSSTDSRQTPDANWPELHDVREFANMVVVYRIPTDTSTQTPTGTFVSSQLSGDNKIAITVNYKPVGAEVQTLLPSADSVDGTWTDQGGGTSLAAAIDETTASDTDYIRSELGPSSSATRVKLVAGSDPLSSTGHIIHWRAGKDTTGGNTINMTVKLYQGGGNSIGGGTLIASFTRNAVDAFTTYDETLSSGQADSITNYSDLYLEFSANQT